MGAHSEGPAWTQLSDWAEEKAPSITDDQEPAMKLLPADQRCLQGYGSALNETQPLEGV